MKNTDSKASPESNPGVVSSAWFDDVPVGRWMTFGETVRFMANFPLASDMIWAGHKDNPRQTSSGTVLSVLERVALLRHVVRLAELQMARLHLAAIQIYRGEFHASLVTLRILSAYFIKSSNDGTEPRRADDVKQPATARQTRDASRRWLQ